MSVEARTSAAEGSAELRAFIHFNTTCNCGDGLAGMASEGARGIASHTRVYTMQYRTFDLCQCMGMTKTICIMMKYRDSGWQSLRNPVDQIDRSGCHYCKYSTFFSLVVRVTSFIELGSERDPGTSCYHYQGQSPLSNLYTNASRVLMRRTIWVSNLSS